MGNLKEFKQRINHKYNNHCSFAPAMCPTWADKNLTKSDDDTETCTNVDKLKIYRKDGNLENNTEENVLLLCPFHYGVMYYELRTKIKQRKEKFEGKRKEKRKPDSISFEEFKQILSVIRNPNHTMILQFLFYTGARVSELIALRPLDIIVSSNKGMINFRAETTKRKVERDVDIPQNMVIPIKTFIKGKETSIPLFNLTKQRVWQLIKQYTKEAGIKKNVHPHTFRHSYATMIYNKTGDLKLVQELLGHKNLTTTSIYAHINKEYRREKLNNVFDGD